jgi:hypothetical protein
MRRVVLAVILSVAAACGGSPSEPSSSPSGSPVDFSGLWQGSLKYTQCEGMRHCFARVGSSVQLSLRVRQTQARVRALLVISGSAVDLSGEVLKDGTVELTGSSPLASPSNPDFDAAVTVQRLSLRLDPGAGLVGSVAYRLQAGRENSEFNLATLGGDMMNVSRSDLAPFASTFDGTWSGRYVVRSCVPIGRYCYSLEVDDLGDVELRLMQNGTQVTGTFGTVPVMGEVSGRSLTLSGEQLYPSSGGGRLMRITSWHASIDEFGRMVGTFEYLDAWPADAPRLGSTARAELWQVVKVP